MLKGDGVHLPQGMEFLEYIAAVYNRQAEVTDKFIREGGKKLPKNAEYLGDTLAYLYGYACCLWGCKGGDHTLEWLSGRVCNQALASLTLVKCGSYDEALMLARGIGEIANLLWLFQADQTNISIWKSSNRKLRLKEFGPAAVRSKIEALGQEPPISKQRYQNLCEVGTHPVPGNAPGHFSGTGRPVLGGFLQEAGVFVCMSELGLAVAGAAVPLCVLSGLDKSLQNEIFAASVKLVDNLGAFDINSYEELLAKVHEHHAACTNSLPTPS